MEQTNDSYPLLSKINSPADLRKLDETQLPQVCDEIRKFLIQELSVHPGHFASSMGTVELTVALHYVFNTPYDRIVWDVGHQAYGHKILTGRRDRFYTNRTLNGLSGFPDPSESEYDTFTAGHASNSISAALGMSVASQLKNETPKRSVVAVIGDASISGGLAFEGINNAANTPNNLMIILNDNDMSIDDNVGSLSTYLSHINTSKGYNNFRYKCYKFLKHHGVITDTGKGRIMRFNNSLKSLLTNNQNIFEGLDIRYFGPFDGHDVRKLVKLFRETRDMTGPKLLHLRTVKGKGFEPAENDPTVWHAPGKFDPDTGEILTDPKKGDKPLKYQQVFGETLIELAEKDPRIVAITAAMASGTSISMMQKEMPERVFDVGISEGHALTFAGGLAKDGMRPVVGIYSSFLQRAFDNVIHDVAIQSLPVVLCIDRAGIVGEDGVTHHGAYDLSYLKTVPNMVVSAASDEHTLRNLMYTALHQDKSPMAIRYPRGSGTEIKWRNEMHEIPIGKGRKLHDGNDAIVMTIGTIADDAAKAIEMAEKDGITVRHYDMLFLKPIDIEILIESANTGLPIITIEDGTINGGLGSTVAQFLATNHYDNPLTILGIPDKFIRQGTVAQLKKICGIDAESIYIKIKEAVKK